MKKYSFDKFLANPELVNDRINEFIKEKIITRTDSQA
jgi:hypothetical protein